ncbi:MAG: hypothetical protein R3D58_18955 [Saprospiraceae bacterium]
MKFYFLIFLLLPCWSTAQNHDYHWVMGYNNPVGADTSGEIGGMFMDFNHRPPLRYKKNIGLDFGLFGAACSDSLGRLLYYSNGIRIYNKDHQLMENGDTINPGPVWLSNEFEGYPNVIGGLSIPKPGAANQYYFIHLALLLNNGLFFTPLYYSVIDMNANGGVGRVLEKNKILLEGDLTMPALVKHANGRDWWLLVGQQNSPVVYRFLFSPAGIEGPWEQTTSLQFPEEDGASSCLFSPDGTWYLRSDASNGLNLFSFNRCNGELSNLKTLPFIANYFDSGGAAFSSDSRYIYIARPDFILQFDLSIGNLSFGTMDTVQFYDQFSDPFPPFLTRYFFCQLGPDGKLYMPTSSTTSYMHVIHRPDLPGPMCDVENHGMKLPRYNGRTVCYFPNYRLGAWEGSPCDTLEFQGPSSPGFYKTSYEVFLEREAQVSPQKTIPGIVSSESTSQLPPLIGKDRAARLNFMDFKTIILQELALRGQILKPDQHKHKNHENH